jgi:hypothetical protein
MRPYSEAVKADGRRRMGPPGGAAGGEPCSQSAPLGEEEGHPWSLRGSRTLREADLHGVKHVDHSPVYGQVVVGQNSQPGKSFVVGAKMAEIRAHPSRAYRSAVLEASKISPAGLFGPSESALG